MHTAFADENSGHQTHRGTDILNIVGGGINVARCGDFPNVELQFAGEGTDTIGGPFSAVAAACRNTATDLVFDLQAVDTYAISGDTVAISSAPFFLIPNPETCVATNGKPVKYTVTGGSGAYTNATGSGTYHIYVTDPMCSGVTLPAFVAFEGTLKP
jgi:hypothetical protein